MRDAEAHADEDRQRREEADTRNQADSLVYQTEKLLREQGEAFEGDEKANVEQALATLKEALSGTDVAAITAATQGLATASQSLSQRLYEQAAQAQQSGAATGSAGSDDDVIDAEIVD